MDKEQAIEFAKASACGAFDQAPAYGGLENSIASHRENVRDTLNDEGAADFEADAFSAFDAEVSRLRNQENAASDAIDERCERASDVRSREFFRV